ncbi:UDP-glucose 4-epimerase GalE [Georgenia sp. 311]|uniref:UDP-glucose 4-epimerase n=1 Tax=Georgenia wutianyii TaxID=2585135 RepID=A0ABX5VKW6_9MICO|nr:MULTISPECIES: UDP-glucose 4-epimerase GalE [Georgenia]QDB78426.1 UDP-glucose 4-epimerase GalE [Georgenia wutianyii]TNC16508.1 UDP-glucose 4-epimerase GalE [Georgenia sp. 311]
MSIMVTGGAGYIGAHVVRLLQERGEDVVVVDDLSTGREDRVGDATLVELDVAGGDAQQLLEQVMREREVTGVVHFAARKQVGESVARPAWYFQQNVTGLANVVAAMEAVGADRLIFSSSAAVYGMPDVEIVTEDTDPRPINPYGETKLVGEWLIADAGRAWGLRAASLRYFNVAGAGWPDLGDPAVLNLVPMVLDRLAKGERPKVFGEDYPTTDGTCIRDYIHVLDLAHAHLAALDHLAGGDGGNLVLNVGTGQGASVKEVITEIGRVSGLDVTPDVEERRAGDPPRLVASADRIAEVLGWQTRNGLPEIIESAWEAWQAGPRRIG